MCQKRCSLILGEETESQQKKKKMLAKPRNKPIRDAASPEQENKGDCPSNKHLMGGPQGKQ